jgi:formylglycine-generating enzyme required for sulfatase activity
MSHAGTERYAPPEQTGEMAGAIGPYTDVYAWGMTFKDVLFGHLQPGDDEWEVDEIPEPYRSTFKRLFAQCVRRDIDLRSRFPRVPSFVPVLEALAALDPNGREARAQRARETQERQRRAEEAERQRVAAAEADHIAAEKQAEVGPKKREAPANQEQAERLELWKRSGHPRAWVEKHLDGWDHTAWTALVAELKASPYWPLKAEEIASVIEGLASELRAERDRRRAAEAAEKQRQEEARRKAEEEAKAKDPFHPGRKRTAGETISFPLGNFKTGGFLGFGTKDLDVNLSFAWCPPGTFRMGSEHPEAMKIDGCNATERPVHSVTLTKGFFMGVHPVTQAQWKVVMGTDPSCFKGPNRPVEQVSWDDCQEFCQKLTGLMNAKGARVTVRLPTEAEWEYACRAGTTSEFWFGDVIDVSKANYNGNYQWNGSPKGQCRQQTTDVWGLYDVWNGSPKGQWRQQTTDVGTVGGKNPWGLYDVHGNVWEWCQDAWDEAFYSKSPGQDPICEEDQTSARVLRGGSWRDTPGYCRSAYRFRRGRGTRNYGIIGLRVCFRLDG